MTGITRPGYHAPGAYNYTYYVCPWLKSNARDTRRCPEHVRASVREDHITTAISGFLDKYLLGHDRAAMLAGHLPKTAAEEAANREARAAELTRRIARNEAAQKGLMTELAELGDAASLASTAYRQRIRALQPAVRRHRRPPGRTRHPSRHGQHSHRRRPDRPASLRPRPAHRGAP
jgi:hypothetical protein